MAVVHKTVTVGTSATWLYTAPVGIQFARVYITNHDNADVFIGDDSVTTNDGSWGFTIKKDGNYFFEMGAGEMIYGVSGTSANVTILVFGV